MTVKEPGQGHDQNWEFPNTNTEKTAGSEQEITSHEDEVADDIREKILPTQIEHSEDPTTIDHEIKEIKAPNDEEVKAPKDESKTISSSSTEESNLKPTISRIKSTANFKLNLTSTNLEARIKQEETKKAEPQKEVKNEKSVPKKSGMVDLSTLGSSEVKKTKEELRSALESYNKNIRGTEKAWKNSVPKEFKFEKGLELNLKYDIKADIKDTEKQIEFFRNKNIQLSESGVTSYVTELGKKCNVLQNEIKKLEENSSRLKLNVNIVINENQGLNPKSNEYQTKVGRAVKEYEINESELQEKKNLYSEAKAEYDQKSSPGHYATEMSSALNSKLDILNQLKNFKK